MMFLPPVTSTQPVPPGPGMPRTDSWRQLRSMRYDPPGLASRGARKKVFTSALEQAEQLFTAAEGAGYASRPLLVFYGLSQAGRAIAAAAKNASATEWALDGHGIKASNLDGPLPDIQIVDQRGGKNPSFLRLAAIFSSPSLPRGCHLSAVWDTLPELRDYPLRDGPDRRSPVTIIPLPSTYYDTSPQALAWASGLPRGLVSAQNQRQAVTEFLASYPILHGFSFPGDSAAPLGFSDHEGYTRLLLAWSASEGLQASQEERAATIRQLVNPYRSDDSWALPAIAGNDQPLHPLLSWWAVLFTLSMLARYEPARWTHHIDVDMSDQAVRLEVALDTALEACPELILRAMRFVSV